jgi:glucose-1-phosphate cytidylyltransferase
MITKAIILAGGYGTRISELTHSIPKPMIKIGERPILWHIMKYYHSFGVKDFIICGGYKIEVINKFFDDYRYMIEDFEIDFANDTTRLLTSKTEDWKVTILNTGTDTMTGGRLVRTRHLLEKGENVFMTYGDGLSSIDLVKLSDHHFNAKKLVTVSAVIPSARFGAISYDQKTGEVNKFQEKPKGDGMMINGGFFVVNEEALKFVKNDDEPWENAPMQRLTSANQLSAYTHTDFWKPMDTKRDLDEFNSIWATGKAPWKRW